MLVEIKLVEITVDQLTLFVKELVLIVLLEPMDSVPQLLPVPTRKSDQHVSQELMDHAFGSLVIQILMELKVHASHILHARV